MVNTTFPKPIACPARQSNIYGKCNATPFARIFGEFRAARQPSIHKTAVTQVRSAFTREVKRQGRVMFFLLRMAFWLGLVLVLLPRDQTPEADKAPQVGASDAVSAATAAVSDMSQFCSRQPAACQIGGQAATALGQRAQDGAKKLYKIITDKKAPDHTGSIPDIAELDAIERATVKAPETLTLDDLQTPWTMPAAMATDAAIK
jgi:hypothetical protein